MPVFSISAMKLGPSLGEVYSEPFKASPSLTIYAKDTAGNTGVSQTITFTVIKLEPFIIIAFVLTGVAVAVALLVRRRHHKIGLL